MKKINILIAIVNIFIFSCLVQFFLILGALIVFVPFKVMFDANIPITLQHKIGVITGLFGWYFFYFQNIVNFKYLKFRKEDSK